MLNIIKLQFNRKKLVLNDEIQYFYDIKTTTTTFNLMKKITLLLLMCLPITVAFARIEIDMTKELSNITGNLIIDGNALQAKHGSREQIVIIGKDMVLNDRSSFLFQNVLVQLSGRIVVKGATRPLLLDAYIFCKDSGPLKSDNILTLKKFDDIYIAKVDYIKNLPGDPEICIYSSSGTRVYKGKKSETGNVQLPIAMYDVKVVGVEFKNKLLFIN